jgi:ATPase subunit of ABC transporter with duplicated ATPase domains
VVWDEQAKVGYYSQELDTLDMEQTLLQTLQAKCVGHEQTLRSFLGRFMFSGDMIYQSIKTLSGGEKTRLAIALLVTQDFNVLILDEPTTYLDPLSQRIILEAIKEYRGTLLVVSHTEDFIRELKPDRAILMPEQQVDYWKNEYLERVADL